MFNTANDTNILRSFGGLIAAAVLTITVFYGAAGPDPRADVYTAGLSQVASAEIAPTTVA